jgi:hypothetical protein
MIRYTWYAARLITSREVFCNVNQLAFLAEEKLQNVGAASKHSLDVCGVANVCIFILFTMSAIHNPASISP